MLNQQAPYIILAIALFFLIYIRLINPTNDPGFDQFFLLILLPIIVSAMIISRHYGLTLGLLTLYWPWFLFHIENLTGIKLTQNLTWMVALIYIIFFYSIYLLL